MINNPDTFGWLRNQLLQYSPPFAVKKDTAQTVELWSTREVTIVGRKRKELFFSSATIQKGYTSFHYMPIYMMPGIADSLDPILMDTLKSKSCFHISIVTPELATSIGKALLLGFTFFKDQGFIVEI